MDIHSFAVTIATASIVGGIFGIIYWKSKKIDERGRGDKKRNTPAKRRGKRHRCKSPYRVIEKGYYIDFIPDSTGLGGEYICDPTKAKWIRCPCKKRIF